MPNTAPDGFVLDVYNASGQQMTIKNQDSNGGTVPASNQIQTLRGTGSVGDFLFFVQVLHSSRSSTMPALFLSDII